MCRQGNTIGGDLSELAAIIELVFDRTRVGVCLDTCHALAAGYDLASDAGFDAFIDEFERIVGFKYLVAVHLNDSEGILRTRFNLKSNCSNFPFFMPRPVGMPPRSACLHRKGPHWPVGRRLPANHQLSPLPRHSANLGDALHQRRDLHSRDSPLEIFGNQRYRLRLMERPFCSSFVQIQPILDSYAVWFVGVGLAKAKKGKDRHPVTHDLLKSQAS